MVWDIRGMACFGLWLAYIKYSLGLQRASIHGRCFFSDGFDQSRPRCRVSTAACSNSKLLCDRGPSNLGGFEWSWCPDEMDGGGVLRCGWCARWPGTLLLFLFSLGASVQVCCDNFLRILYSRICIRLCLDTFSMSSNIQILFFLEKKVETMGWMLVEKDSRRTGEGEARGCLLGLGA